MHVMHVAVYALTCRQAAALDQDSINIGRSPLGKIRALETIVQTFSREVGDARCVAFSGVDSSTAATGHWNGTAIIWQKLTRQPVHVLEGHSGAILAVSFSPDGEILATGSTDGKAILWNVTTGQEIRRLSSGPGSGFVNAVAVGPSGRTFIGRADGSVVIWEAHGQVVAFGDHTNLKPLMALKLSDDGGQLLTASNKTVTLWDVSSGARLQKFRGHSEWVTSIAFSPDERTVLTGSQDNTAMVWSASTGRRLLTLSGHLGDVLSVAFSPNGDMALTGSRNSELWFWDALTGEPLRKVRVPVAKPRKPKGVGAQVVAAAYATSSCSAVEMKGDLMSFGSGVSKRIVYIGVLISSGKPPKLTESQKSLRHHETHEQCEERCAAEATETH